ncbi:MAG TPA: hypothetical protein DEF61_01525 [Firmicutes bacterium]|nr:hypothetical protein [Bacillota bacterium]
MDVIKAVKKVLKNINTTFVFTFFLSSPMQLLNLILAGARLLLLLLGFSFFLYYFYKAEGISLEKFRDSQYASA